MIVPNSFILAENAREHQHFLLEEAKRDRLYRSHVWHERGPAHRLQRQIGERLIMIGEWLRGEDDQPAASHQRRPASA
jgi:hypothetical protein